MLLLVIVIALLCGQSGAEAESYDPPSTSNAAKRLLSPSERQVADPQPSDAKDVADASERQRSIVSACPEIHAAAAMHHLPAGFLIKLIWQESRFNPDAVSRAGAQGIAQFMPATARWRGLDDPFNPYQSVHESARWLGELRQQFGNLGLAAAAYNAGPGRVQDWLAGKRTLPAETRAYVRIITGRKAEEWARSSARDENVVLPAPPDCRIKEGFSRTVRRPYRNRLTARAGHKPSARAAPDKGIPTWSLQLVGDRSKQKALNEYNALQKRFPRLLGKREPVVIERRLGGRSPSFWYQVRVAEVTRQSADVLCSRLRSAGGQCLVLSK